MQVDVVAVVVVRERVGGFSEVSEQLPLEPGRRLPGRAVGVAVAGGVGVQAVEVLPPQAVVAAARQVGRTVGRGGLATAGRGTVAPVALTQGELVVPRPA